MPRNGSPMNMDDIESALDILDSNGGIGAFEELEDTSMQERWLFPRYPGATDPSHQYLSRAGIGEHDSDVETLVAWLDAPRVIVGGIMLLGLPGTGKTALAQAACTHADREFVVITATPDHTKDSLFMRFVGEGNGDLVSGNPSPFVKAVVPDAIEKGKTLIVDEFMLFADGLKPVFYPALDGSLFLPEAAVDGSAIEIHPDFRLIVTANPGVRGASLPEPIASRFASTTITIETSAAMLRDLSIDDSIVAAWEALGTQKLWQPQIREVRLADYWMGVSVEQAVSAMVPEHCPESQRGDVRDLVVSFLGGNIRPDGRLVVS